MKFIFLIKCPKYSHIRNHLFSLVQKLYCKNFFLLNDKAKFDWLLSNTDNSIAIELSKFIDEAFTIHD